MKASVYALAAFVLGMTSFAADAHAAVRKSLQSREGTEIRLEYELQRFVSNSNKPSSVDYAQPVQFTVKRGRELGPSDQVRVVLINREYFTGYCGLSSYNRDPHYVIDLNYHGGMEAFVGTFESARLILNGAEVPLRREDQRVQVRANGYCYNLVTAPELAVVVNGQWQTDPINGTHNFKFDFLAP